MDNFIHSIEEVLWDSKSDCNLVDCVFKFSDSGYSFKLFVDNVYLGHFNFCDICFTHVDTRITENEDFEERYFTVIKNYEPIYSYNINNSLLVDFDFELLENEYKTYKINIKTYSYADIFDVDLPF